MRSWLTFSNAALVLVLFLSCDSGGGDRPAAPSTRPSSSLVSTPAAKGPARSLLYLDGNDLRTFDLATGRDRFLAQAPSTDATATPDGDRIAYVVSSSPGPTDEDFIAVPELQIADVSSGALSDAGAGFSPMWSPDGSRLAALVPAEARGCEGETCLGTVSAAVIEPATGDRTTVVEPGRMSLLGWWGDRLLIGLQDPPSVIASSVDGSLERLDFVPNEVWGPAPNGDSLLVVDEDSARFARPDSPAIADSVPLDGLMLGEGAWAPNSSEVAAVGLGRGGSQIVLLGPHDGRPRPVARSGGAQGQIVWAPDSGSFVFARSIGGRGLRLQALHCRMRNEVACSPLFSWGRGVRLLALVP